MEIILNVKPSYDYWGNLISYVKKPNKKKTKRRKKKK